MPLPIVEQTAVTYRRRASPLHAARAGIGAVWCVTLGLVALSIEHPLVLGVLLATVLAAAARGAGRPPGGALARVGRPVRAS